MFEELVEALIVILGNDDAREHVRWLAEFEDEAAEYEYSDQEIGLHLMLHADTMHNDDAADLMRRTADRLAHT